MAEGLNWSPGDEILLIEDDFPANHIPWFRQERKGAQVRLVPANQTMSPMEFHASQVEIRGVVRGLIRHF